MSYSVPADIEDLSKRVRSFVVDKIIPFERDPRQFPHGPNDEMRTELAALAKEAGLLSCHLPKDLGGQGLDHKAKAVVFEAAGYSPLGPVALNCAAPDEGNMHLLEAIATGAQKERWLAPLASAQIRSCFCMTEPGGGAGSDPQLLTTHAQERDGTYVINGRKWLITGAIDAGFAIIMANTKTAHNDDMGATMFLSDMNTPGISIERTIETNDNCFTGGHAIVRFEDVEVPKENILGALGEGFRYAQVRLGPARLTHCSRWLGAAQRAHDIACAYAVRRTAFGKKLSDHEGVSFQLADNEMDLHVSRQTVHNAASVLDTGEHGNIETSMAKVICSEAEFRVVDRAVQILGGLGLTNETVVERLFRELRGFRIYDGPSELHRWNIARKITHRFRTSKSTEHLSAIGAKFADPDSDLFVPTEHHPM